jgi:hypothetical protein
MPIDLWRYLSLDTAIVLGGGGAAAGIAHIWDDDLKQEVETSVRLNDALQPGNTYGSFPVQVVMASVRTVSGGCSTPRRWRLPEPISCARSS